MKLAEVDKVFPVITPLMVDGALYIIIAVCGFAATMCGSDEAYKLFSERTMFWVKLVNGSMLAGATALKMFRSTAFADDKRKKENGQEHDTNK